MLKRLIRPFLIRWRRFMQAELMHEVIASRNLGGGGGGVGPGMANAMENALLTIALHAEE